ncbi:MAG TPA: NAD-dependent protein deacylase [Candidatus Acidoferrales bacterium]|nr:NAD-dependent protein deacylase [Candidatus Acidoferrales bacterium]
MVPHSEAERPHDLELAAGLIAAARRGLALTGAGVSQESGIPTFRGPDGLWRRYDPVKVSSLEYFMQDPAAYWSVARERGQLVLQALPNAGHHALAALEEAGHLAAVATQNTDGLHLDAGSRRVIELHGSGRTVRCLDCGARETRAAVHARLAAEMPPRCLACGGGHLKPTTILFGEPMPAAATAEAFELAQAADLMLVAGTSLAVYPAAQLPLVALEAGAPLVIVNAEPTPFDRFAAVVLHGRSGEILPQLVERVVPAGRG